MVFGEFTMSRTQIPLWYNQFMKGRKDVINDARSVCPSTSTADENIEVVNRMCVSRITIREVTDYICISFGSC